MLLFKTFFAKEVELSLVVILIFFCIIIFPESKLCCYIMNSTSSKFIFIFNSSICVLRPLYFGSKEGWILIIFPSNFFIKSLDKIFIKPAKQINFIFSFLSNSNIFFSVF